MTIRFKSLKEFTNFVQAVKSLKPLEGGQICKTFTQSYIPPKTVEVTDPAKYEKLKHLLNQTDVSGEKKLLQDLLSGWKDES